MRIPGFVNDEILETDGDYAGTAQREQGGEGIEAAFFCGPCILGFKVCVGFGGVTIEPC